MLCFISANILSKQEIREWGQVFCARGVLGLDYFHVKCDFGFDRHVWKDEFCANHVNREAIVPRRQLRASNSSFESKHSIRLLELLSVEGDLCPLVKSAV